MTIETSFSMKQVVWFMNENKPTSKLVVGILVDPIRGSEYPKINYELGGTNFQSEVEFTKPQRGLYITKEELLKSL